MVFSSFRTAVVYVISSADTQLSKLLISPYSFFYYISYVTEMSDLSKKPATNFIYTIYSGKGHRVMLSRLHKVLTIQHTFNKISKVKLTLDVALFAENGHVKV